MEWLRFKNRSKKKMAVAPRDTATGSASLDRHESVRTSDPYSFAVSHRRLAWMLRVSAGTNIVLGACLMISLTAWSALLPLKETEIALVRADPDDNRIYRIEPATALTVQGFDLLMESMARRYVRLLLEIDTVTQTERFREAFRMTDNLFYERFKKERIDTREVQTAIDSGLTRSIIVESVDFIENTHGTYKYAVDFVQIDERKGELVERRKVRAYLNMTTRPQSVSATERFENPLGVTVIDLVLKERNNS
jgi:type IV secretory pathway component VirB8